MNHYIEIVRYDDGEVVNRMGPQSERRAEKIERGVMMNLDHENYYTRIVEEVP